MSLCSSYGCLPVSGMIISNITCDKGDVVCLKLDRVLVATVLSLCHLSLLTLTRMAVSSQILNEDVHLKLCVSVC